MDNRSKNEAKQDFETMSYHDLNIILKNYLLDLENTNLSDKVKKDNQKVTNCFMYILHNMSLIQGLIGDDPKKKWESQLPHFINGDKEKGVFRDNQGTSFHVEHFVSANDAKQSFERLIRQFTSATVIANKHQQTKEFAKKINYDEIIGCTEQRIGPALDFARDLQQIDILGGGTSDSLKNLMAQCYAAFNDQTIEKNLFSFSADYFYRFNKINRPCLHDGEITLLTPSLLSKYISSLHIASPCDQDTVFAHYRRLTLPIRPINSMIAKDFNIYFNFATAEKQQQFFFWLRIQPALQNSIDETEYPQVRITENHHSKEDKNDTQYLVILPVRQFIELCGVNNLSWVFPGKQMSSDYRTQLLANLQAHAVTSSTQQPVAASSAAHATTSSISTINRTLPAMPISIQQPSAPPKPQVPVPLVVNGSPAIHSMLAFLETIAQAPTSQKHTFFSFINLTEQMFREELQTRNNTRNLTQNQSSQKPLTVNSAQGVGNNAMMHMSRSQSQPTNAAALTTSGSHPTSLIPLPSAAAALSLFSPTTTPSAAASHSGAAMSISATGSQAPHIKRTITDAAPQLDSHKKPRLT